MKISGRRVLPLLLALLLAFGSMVSVVAAAAENDNAQTVLDSDVGETAETEQTPTGKPFQPTDTYVFAFGSKSGASEYAYFSPFVPLLTYDNTEVKGYSILFGLKNTHTGEVSEIAYCTDMPVDAVNANYQRLNLSDSTYAAAYADKLRAIVLNSYPHTSLENLAAASGIEGLTMCEAITGTQLAIWKSAHGDIVQIEDFLYTAAAGYNSGHSEPTTTERKEYYDGTDEHKAAVKARIQALYEYLMKLPEQKATSRVISASAFLSRSTEPTVTENEDGTYNITVNAKVDIPTGSDVTLTAYVGEGYWYAQEALSTGKSEHTLTIENVPAKYKDDAVTLSIDGTQTVQEDVFLLDAEGVRGVSQSMIAPLSGTLPAHADVLAEPDRVHEIHKTAEGSPLSGISFEVYYVGSLTDYLSGKLSIGTKPTADDIAKFGKTKNLVGTITTDADGYGSLNLHTADGVYLVKELPDARVTDSVSYFVVLPDYSRLDASGKPSYVITAYPKNMLDHERVEIEKDVTLLDNEHSTFAVGENHTWIIQSSVPEGLATGKEYTISDTLDKRLTLVSVDKVTLAEDGGTFGNSELSGYRKDENETPLGEETLVLEKDKHYTVSNEASADGCDSFTVSLTREGMKAVADAATESGKKCEIRVYFTAQINQNAAMGENIPNQAHVTYKNSADKTYTADSDCPEVHTGGARLKKVNESGAVLSGAEFRVYRMATQEEVADKKFTEIKYGETTYKMMPVSFYDNAEMSDEKKDTLVTDEDGKGCIYGLAYGTYYLVEEHAPSGYNKLHEPIEFAIDAQSHTEEKAITVTNTAGTELPTTGGAGTAALYVWGAALCAVAVAVLALRSSKPRKRA